MDDNTNPNPVTIEQALDQIQNWINSGNADMAREGLQEVLEMEPTNMRALDLQNQLNNMSAASMPSFEPTPAPSMNNDIQIGSISSEPAPAPAAPMSEPAPMPETSGGGPINLDAPASMTPEVTPVAPTVEPAMEPAVTPTVDFSQPTPTPSSPFEPVTQPEPTPEASVSPSFEIPSTPAGEPSSPFEASVTESMNAEPAPVVEAPTTETQPTLDATDKKAIILKALIPLAIAIILGIGIYFAYQYFSGDETDNGTETPTNDIVTQPDTSEDVKDSDTEEEDTAEDTTDTDSDTDADADTDSDTDVNDGGIIKDGKGETETETKVKVKRPVKATE